MEEKRKMGKENETRREKKGNECLRIKIVPAPLFLNVNVLHSPICIINVGASYL